MRSPIAVLLAFVALAVCAGIVRPGAASAEDENATSIAMAFDEQFATACNAGDQAKLIGFYADDAIAIFPGDAKIGRDRASIQAMLKRLCDPDLGVSVRLNQVEGIRLDPDHILLVGEWTITAPDSDGNTTQSGVRATEILVKTKAGWRYLLDHASNAPARPSL